LIRQNTGVERKDFPSQQYQLNKAFATEDEADNFALQTAMQWVDRN
jgi:hypothetical protein